MKEQFTGQPQINFQPESPQFKETGVRAPMDRLIAKEIDIARLLIGESPVNMNKERLLVRFDYLCTQAAKETPKYAVPYMTERELEALLEGNNRKYSASREILTNRVRKDVTTLADALSLILPKEDLTFAVLRSSGWSATAKSTNNILEEAIKRVCGTNSGFGDVDFFDQSGKITTFGKSFLFALMRGHINTLWEVQRAGAHYDAFAYAEQKLLKEHKIFPMFCPDENYPWQIRSSSEMHRRFDRTIKDHLSLGLDMLHETLKIEDVE